MEIILRFLAHPLTCVAYGVGGALIFVLITDYLTRKQLQENDPEPESDDPPSTVIFPPGFEFLRDHDPLAPPPKRAHSEVRDLVRLFEQQTQNVYSSFQKVLQNAEILAERDSELGNLRARLQDETKVTRELQDASGEQALAIDELREHMAVMEARYTDLEEVRHTLEAELQVLITERDALTEQQDQTREEHASLQAHLTEAQASVNLLEQKLADLTAANEAMAEGNAELAGQVDQADDENAADAFPDEDDPLRDTDLSEPSGDSAALETISVDEDTDKESSTDSEVSEAAEEQPIQELPAEQVGPPKAEELPPEEQEDFEAFLGNFAEEPWMSDIREKAPDAGKDGYAAALTAIEEAEESNLGPMINLISEMPLFGDLSQDEISKAAAVSQLKNFSADEDIIKLGEKGDYLFIILDGEVTVLKEDANGNSMELSRLGEGDFFGEMSILTGDPRSATIRTLTDVSVLAMHKDYLMELMAMHPHILTAFNEALAERLKKTEAKFKREIDEGVAGKLDLINLTELLQTIVNGQKTGKLFLSRGQHNGIVSFAAGQIIAAETEHRTGENAFYYMLHWQDGTFRFRHASDNSLSGNIAAETPGLLIEGIRRFDAAREIEKHFPPFDAMFFIDPDYIPFLDNFDLSDHAHTLAAAFDGKHNLGEVITNSGKLYLETLQAIMELYSQGLLNEPETA